MVRASVAVCRVAKGGDEDEMIDRLGCHWADRRLLVEDAAVDRQGRKTHEREIGGRADHTSKGNAGDK